MNRVCNKQETGVFGNPTVFQGPKAIASSRWKYLFSQYLSTPIGCEIAAKKVRDSRESSEKA